MLPNVSKQPKASVETPAVPDFEGALAELEALVQRLERGEQTLEQALADFERGVHLARGCQEALARAELRVQELLGASDPARAEASRAPGADTPDP